MSGTSISRKKSVRAARSLPFHLRREQNRTNDKVADEQIASAIAQGLSTTKAADKLNMSQSTLWRRMKKMELKPNFPVGGNGRPSKLTDEEVAYCDKFGLSIPEAASVLHTTTSAIYYRKTKLNLRMEHAA